jgi:hypothetical protein
VRIAAALDEPARRRDLVGSVDRTIETVEARDMGRTSNPSSRAARAVCGGVCHVDGVLQCTSGQKSFNCRAAAEADVHPHADEPAPASAAACFSRSVDPVIDGP